MNAIADIADRIMALPERNRSGTLQIWGQWFGRPMDNVHVCKSCEARQDHIVLGFDNGERLAVWYPENIKTRGFTLIIERASRVRWEWYYYGRAQSPENLLFIEYALEGGEVSRASNEPWSNTNQTKAKAHAVELVGM